MNPSVHVPQDELDRMWDCILLYDEHTGAYNSISDPKSDFVTRQFAVKAAYAAEAANRARRLLDRGMRQLCSGFRLRPDSLFVFNPSGRTCSGVVNVDIPRGSLVLGDAGVVPQQVVREDATDAVGVAFLASDVAPAGYKLHRVGKAEQAAVLPKGFDVKVLENDFFRVEFSPVAAWPVARQELGKELVDQSSATSSGRSSTRPAAATPTAARPRRRPILSRVKYNTTTAARVEAAGPGRCSRRQVDHRAPADSHAELEVILYEPSRAWTSSTGWTRRWCGPRRPCTSRSRSRGAPAVLLRDRRRLRAAE